MRPAPLIVLGVLALGLAASSSEALVLCMKKKSGALRARESCRRREQLVDPAALGLVGPPGPAGSVGPAGPPGTPAWERPCPPDSVAAGSVCIDTYEASVWRIPAGQTAVIAEVRAGTATAAELAAGGFALGLGTDDYAPCTDQGADCADVYAVSIPGVLPSVRVTWFQAQQACANAGKRLPANAEWQQAVADAPDPGGDDGTTDCNTATAGAIVPAGSRSGCVSRAGAFDLVGNLFEWVGDWVPASTANPGWGTFSDDTMGLAGASPTIPGPGALIRGGNFANGDQAGPLAVFDSLPSESFASVGFRCVR